MIQASFCAPRCHFVFSFASSLYSDILLEVLSSILHTSMCFRPLRHPLRIAFATPHPILFTLLFFNPYYLLSSSIEPPTRITSSFKLLPQHFSSYPSPTILRLWFSIARPLSTILFIRLHLSVRLPLALSSSYIHLLSYFIHSTYSFHLSLHLSVHLSPSSNFILSSSPILLITNSGFTCCFIHQYIVMIHDSEN